MTTPLFQNVDCFGVQVPDIDQALAFYGEALGHRLLWRTATSAGLGFAEGGPPELVLHTEVWAITTAIKVASVAEAVERFVASGGRLVEAPSEIPIGRLAVVADPWNNHIVLLDSSKGRLLTDREGNVTGVGPRVIPFEPSFEQAVVELIVGIQRGEFEIAITAEQQPDLRDIPRYYQTGRGNFWVALVGDQVVGTIALLDIGDARAALRKMFVHPQHRGAQAGTARLLLDALLHWAKDNGVRDIFLGTTSKFLAAHRFYEKHGFSEISRQDLPSAFPVMEVDVKFYRRKLPG